MAVNCKTQAQLWGSSWGAGWGGPPSTPGGPLPAEAPFDLFCVCGAATEHLASYLLVSVTPGDPDHNFSDPPEGTYLLRSDDGVRAGAFLSVALPASHTLEIIFRSAEIPSDLGTAGVHLFVGLYDDAADCAGLFLSQAGLAFGGAYDDAPLLIPNSSGLILPDTEYVLRLVVDSERDALYVYLSTLYEATTSAPRLRFVLPLLDAAYVPAHIEGVYLSALGTSLSPSTLEILAVCLSSSAMTANLPPVANPGPDQTVRGTVMARLNGSRSVDPEGAPLTYAWRLSSAPDGSSYQETGLDGTTQTDVSGFVNKLYSSQALGGEAIAFVAGDLLLFQNTLAELVGTGTDGDGTYFEVTESVLPAGVTDEVFQVIRQDGLTDPATVTPTFFPDVTGLFRLELQVRDAELASPWSSVLLNVLERKQALGLIPDASFVWNYLSDTWSILEDPERIESIWAGMYQVLGAELLRLWQAGASKSLRDIPRQVQRRWLAYDLLLKEPYPELVKMTTCWSGVESQDISSGGLDNEGDLLVLSVPGRTELIEITVPAGGSTPPRLAGLLSRLLQVEDARFAVRVIKGSGTNSRLVVHAPFPFTVAAGTTLGGFTVGDSCQVLAGAVSERLDAHTLLLDHSLAGRNVQPDDLIGVTRADGSVAVLRARSVQHAEGDTLLSQRLRTTTAIPADAGGEWAFLMACTSPLTRTIEGGVSQGDVVALQTTSGYVHCSSLGTVEGLPHTVAIELDEDLQNELGTVGAQLALWGVYRTKRVPISPLVTSIPRLQINPWEAAENRILRENVDFFLETEGEARWLRFRNSLFFFESASLNVVRLWAEETFLDNAPVIEGQFGAAVGLTRERVRNDLTDTDYLAAVRGLWFAFARGPRVANLRIASQILLGLPFAEEKSTVVEVDLLYSPSKARLLLQDVANPVNVRSYTYPRTLALEVNPATGKTYVAGDTVEAFAPLVTGVAILDHVNDPTWAAVLVSQGALHQLETLHTFLVRVDLEAFALSALNFVDEFLRRVSPARTKPLFMVRMQDLEADTVDVLDLLEMQGTLSLYDAPGVVPTGTVTGDDPDVSPREGSAAMFDHPDPAPTDGLNTPATTSASGHWKVILDTDIDPATPLSTTGYDLGVRDWGMDVPLLGPEAFISAQLSIDYDGLAAMTVFEDIADPATQPLLEGEFLVYGRAWTPLFNSTGLRLKGPPHAAADFTVSYAQVRIRGKAPAGGRTYVVHIIKNGSSWILLPVTFNVDGEQVFEFGPSPAPDALPGGPAVLLATDEIRVGIYMTGLNVSDQALTSVSVVVGQGVSWDPLGPALPAGTYKTCRTLLRWRGMATTRRLPKRLAGIEARSNLSLTLYDERGKRSARRKGHNIFLTLGRSWLPQAISYSALPAGSPPDPTPVTRADDRGVRYMGVGIGGTRGDVALANVSPLLEHYPGTNLQTDTDPELVQLERPVRLSSPIPGTPVEPPYDADDIWLGQVAAPPTYPTATSVRYSRVFSATEISYGPFLVVPLSEIGLFLHSTSTSYIRTYNNAPIAYDTFDTLKKTGAFSLLVEWELRF